MKEFHFLQQVKRDSRDSRSATIFSSLYFSPSSRLVRYLSRWRYYRLCFFNWFYEEKKVSSGFPPLYQNVAQALQRKRENLARKLAPSLPTNLMLSCAQFVPLPAPQTLPFVQILILSPTHLVCSLPL